MASKKTAVVGCETCGAAGAAVNRPLSVSEELWVRSYERGTGNVALGFAFGREIGLHKVQAALAKAQAKYPLLGARIPTPPKGKQPEFHVCSPPLPLRAEVCDLASTLQAAAGAAASGGGGPPLGEAEPAAAMSDLEKLVEAELGVPIQRSAAGGALDVFQARIYPHGRSTLVVLKMHGAAMDRPALVTVARYVLLALDAEVGGGGGALADSGEVVLPLPEAMEDLIPSTLKTKGYLTKVFDAVVYVATLKKELLPFEPGRADHAKNEFRTEFVGLRFDRQASRGILAACASRGASLFGAECAATLKAVAALKQLSGKKSEEFVITSIINCREHLEPPLAPDSVGLYDSGLPLVERVGMGTPFWDVALHVSETCRASVAKSKQFTETDVLSTLFNQALKHPSFTPSSSLRTSLISGFTSSPQDATWPPAGNLSLTESVGPYASTHGVGACIVLVDTIQDGVLHMSLLYAAPLFSRATMRQLAGLVQENLLQACCSE